MKKIKTLIVLFLICSMVAIVSGVALLRINWQEEQSEYTMQDYIVDATRYYENSCYMQAIVIYEQLMQEGNENEAILEGLAESYHELEEYEKEKEIRERLYQAYPEYQDNWIAMAECEIKLEELDEAKKLVETCFEKDNTNEELADLYAQMNIEAPQFDVPSGSYDQYQLVQLVTQPENAKVYYTLDGSDPIENGKLYTGEIVISAPETVLRAVAIGNLGYKSEMTVIPYTITCEAIEVGTGGYSYNPFRDALYRELGESTLYNYSLAQIREVYIVGNNVAFQQPGVTLYEKQYEYDNYSKSDYKGNMDLSLLQYMPFLQKVCICYQDEVNLDYLADKPYLESVSLINDDIEDISALSNCKHLKELSLGWNRIEDVSLLANMGELQSLGLWNNKIQNVDALSGLKNLVYFDISGNAVSDIGCVAEMQNLNECWLNNNNISDFSPLNSCENLRVLMVAGNHSSDYGTWMQKSVQLNKTDMN